jgi:hypothetical protein
LSDFRSSSSSVLLDLCRRSLVLGWPIVWDSLQVKPGLILELPD